VSAADVSRSINTNEASMADESIAASIIPLHQPKKAKTGAERSRAYRQRKRKKAKAAALPNESPSSEVLIAEGCLHSYRSDFMILAK
jgi:hypothetical protein